MSGKLSRREAIKKALGDLLKVGLGSVVAASAVVAAAEAAVPPPAEIDPTGPVDDLVGPPAPAGGKSGLLEEEGVTSWLNGGFRNAGAAAYRGGYRGGAAAFRNGASAAGGFRNAATGRSGAGWSNGSTGMGYGKTSGGATFGNSMNRNYGYGGGFANGGFRNF